MNDLSTFNAAMQCKSDIERIHCQASDKLRAISGGGALGMTPDHVKQSPEYRAALSSFNYWHARLQQFNTAFLRAYGREYRAFRKLNRNARP